MNEETTLDILDNVDDAAQAFIADRQMLRFYGESWYQYVTTHYKEVPEAKVNADIRRWMVDVGMPPQACRVLLEKMPAGHAARDFIAGIQAAAFHFPDRYPTAKQLYWLGHHYRRFVVPR